MAEKAGLKHVKMQKVEWIIDFFNLKHLRGTLSLRKPVPAILAFISHFRLKQLDLKIIKYMLTGSFVSEKGEKIVPEEEAFACLFKTAFFKGK